MFAISLFSQSVLIGQPSSAHAVLERELRARMYSEIWWSDGAGASEGKQGNAVVEVRMGRLVVCSMELRFCQSYFVIDGHLGPMFHSGKGKFPEHAVNSREAVALFANSTGIWDQTSAASSSFAFESTLRIPAIGEAERYFKAMRPSSMQSLRVFLRSAGLPRGRVRVPCYSDESRQLRVVVDSGEKQTGLFVFYGWAEHSWVVGATTEAPTEYLQSIQPPDIVKRLTEKIDRVLCEIVELTSE